ncbi:hypothetical protein FRB99_003517 [Tulasnella sp. 403]|nr:hypothetical protein FRB99_003517 [Tulasnella sp. 403]
MRLATPIIVASLSVTLPHLVAGLPLTSLPPSASLDNPSAGNPPAAVVGLVPRGCVSGKHAKEDTGGDVNANCNQRQPPSEYVTDVSNTNQHDKVNENNQSGIPTGDDGFPTLPNGFTFDVPTGSDIGAPASSSRRPTIPDIRVMAASNDERPDTEPVHRPSVPADNGIDMEAWQEVYNTWLNPALQEGMGGGSIIWLSEQKKELKGTLRMIEENHKLPPLDDSNDLFARLNRLAEAGIRLTAQEQDYLESDLREFQENKPISASEASTRLSNTPSSNSNSPLLPPKGSRLR